MLIYNQKKREREANKMKYNWYKEGTDNWWWNEVLISIRKELGDKAEDALGNRTVEYYKEVEKAELLWNSARV